MTDTECRDERQEAAGDGDGDGDEDEDRAAWFTDLSPAAFETDATAASARLNTGTAPAPRDWPHLAVEDGVTTSTASYYDQLHAATIAATTQAVRTRERADDQQIKHCVRAMDDCERTANELAERLTEWAGSRFESVTPGVAGAQSIAAREPDDELGKRVVSLAKRVVSLTDERDELEATIETVTPAVAPNLAAMAGPTLAARLIALAGGLEPLAKKPAGTVQVLGAEDALFAHLAGRAPSPKHGVIYTHEFVRGTRPEDRGSAARALAGKLALAARVDHYAGEFRESIHDDLTERMATIRARATDDVKAEETNE